MQYSLSSKSSGTEGMQLFSLQTSRKFKKIYKIAGINITLN